MQLTKDHVFSLILSGGLFLNCCQLASRNQNQAISTSEKNNNHVATATPSQTQQLQVTMDRIADHAKAFLDFSNAHRNDLAQSRVEMNLSLGALAVNSYARAVLARLVVYGQLSCEADRSEVARTITSEVNHYLPLLSQTQCSRSWEL